MVIFGDLYCGVSWCKVVEVQTDTVHFTSMVEVPCLNVISLTSSTQMLYKSCVHFLFFLPVLSEEKNLVCPKPALSTLYKFLIHCNREQQRGELPGSSSSHLPGKVFLCDGNS